MEAVRYRPGEAIKWLETGADRIRDEAVRKAQGVFRRQGERSVAKDVREMAGALWDAGTAALAELARRQGEATQYVLEEESFQLVSGSSGKRYAYSDVRRIRMEGENCHLILERGSVVVKPFAHIVAGRVRVPMGWMRNGVDVPYELLIEELAARIGKEIDFD